MKRPTIYLETSTIAAYWYDGADLATVVRRMRTRDWWEVERRHFALWASGLVEAELSAGVYPREDECVKMVRRLRYLSLSPVACDLRGEILRQGIVPPNKELDAAHLAIATAHGQDYLITWNYAHLANASVQRRLERLCDDFDLDAPVLVSPESIPQVRFGQAIRRDR